MTPPCAWRIDDLAHRAGVTVDTVRYYQREGLLPGGERAGRVKLYGAVHLERLERIRDLQRRGFSLAAIRTLLDRDQSLVEGIFGDQDEARTYSLDELIERAGIDRDLCAALRASGLLRDPAEFGRDAFDGDDLDLLRTMAELHGMGIPPKALIELGRIYAQGIEATQRDVVGLFSTGGNLAWGPGELEGFQAVAGRTAADILPLARHLVDYAHHRTIQRLALGAIERGTITPPD
ncbi:MAG TPA: MerR family transcriptional regulator [Acidimicrobiia bacterium]|nr:MerR family transcriptional regulator [Acidimicrobiia bacterium]